MAVRLTFVGDIALGDHPKAVGFGFLSRYAEGIPSGLAKRVMPHGAKTDFLFGNLEFTLGLDKVDRGDLAQRQCRGLDVYADFLREAGLSAMNVATNHSTQAGDDVFASTVALLRASGIHVVGTPDDFSETGTMVVDGKRVALLGWSDRPRQYAPGVPPYNELSEEAYQQIASARRRADIVIVSMHWGDEFILVPSERERRIARAMIDAGATCVIGHHPHVVREVEEYGGGVIAYSLGNFICDMTWDRRTRATGWLSVEVEAGRVASWSFVPGEIDNEYFPKELTTAPAKRRSGDLANARRAEAARVLRVGYRQTAEQERRRHSVRTAVMVFRNLHRYEWRIAVQTVSGAITHRIRGVVAAARGLVWRSSAARRQSRVFTSRDIT